MPILFSFLQTLKISITVPPSLLQALKISIAVFGRISRVFLPTPEPSPPPLLSSVSLELPHLCLSPSKSITISSSLAPPPPQPRTLLSDSTRTLSSLLTLALSISKLILSLPAHIAATAAHTVPSSAELTEIRDLRGSLACAVGPLFFVALKDRPSRYLNTSLTVVASGIAKWLNIYSGVLMNIILPVFDTLDVSPLAAAAMMSLGPPVKPDEFVPHPIKEQLLGIDYCLTSPPPSHLFLSPSLPPSLCFSPLLFVILILFSFGPQQKLFFWDSSTTW